MQFLADLRASGRTWPYFALMGALWGAFHAYAPAVKAAAGASDLVFGVALFAGAAGSMIAMAAAPRVERLAGRWRLAAAGAFLILAVQGLPRAGDPAQLIAAMTAVGAALGLLDVLMNAEVSRAEASAERSLMSLNHGLYSLAYAAVALAAAPLRAGGTALTMVYAGLAVAGLALVISLPRPGSLLHETAGSGEAAPAARLPAAVFWGGAIVMAAFACENAVESWSALHIERTLSGGAAAGAIGPAALGITMAIGRLGGQVASARLSDLALIRAGSLLAAAGAALAAVAPVPALAYAGFAAAGLGMSVLAPLGLGLIGRLATPGNRALAVSRGALIGYTGFFIGPPLMGSVAEWAGLRWAFLLVAAGLATVPLLLARATRSQAAPVRAHSG